MTAQEAHKALGGTVSSEKNEILYTRFQINYNSLDPLFRRGSIILWEPEPKSMATVEEQSQEEEVPLASKQVSLLSA